MAAQRSHAEPKPTHVDTDEHVGSLAREAHRLRTPTRLPSVIQDAAIHACIRLAPGLSPRRSSPELSPKRWQPRSAQWF
jgi:hypothetical protein